MIRKLIRFLINTLILLIIYIIVANYYIQNDSKEYLFDMPANLPKVKYGLFLGTSKYFKKGEGNEFYNERINATIQLFKENKINKIVVSGTHDSLNYSEPLAIQKDLIARGVPDSVIILDYFGDRTILSIRNFRKTYQCDSLIIISQKFHNERAVYLARKYGLIAWGFNARDIKLSSSYKVLLRELLAKGKALFE